MQKQNDHKGFPEVKNVPPAPKMKPPKGSVLAKQYRSKYHFQTSSFNKGIDAIDAFTKAGYDFDGLLSVMKDGSEVFNFTIDSRNELKILEKKDEVNKIAELHSLTYIKGMSFSEIAGRDYMKNEIG